MAQRTRLRKSATAFRTISEVAEVLDLPAHVLRFWESKFDAIDPLKRGGGRRYYRPEDVDLLRQIQHLLYEDGYTIKGVQKLLRENNGKLDRFVAPAVPTKTLLDPDTPIDTVEEAERLAASQGQNDAVSKGAGSKGAGSKGVEAVAEAGAADSSPGRAREAVLRAALAELKSLRAMLKDG